MLIEFWVAAAALLWLFVLLLPWRPWAVKPYLEAEGSAGRPNLKDVTVLIPARNEADLIAGTLAALTAPRSGIRIIVVDDQSEDATAQAARAAAGAKVTVISGVAPPSGWSGKLWALEQGRCLLDTRYTLLLDADIEVIPALIATALVKMRRENLHFLSLMALPNMESFWEKLLVPAFVYFFKLIYPFGLVNDTRYPRFAGAAGGFVLLETRLLEQMGGFGAIRNELIDDCALARRIKSLPANTWLGLTRSARSLRAYGGLGGIWEMVVRTAYTQLHCSPIWLSGCTLLMLILFPGPLLGWFQSESPGRYLAGVACTAMVFSYLPLLAYYRRSWWWALALPVIGMLFLGMTWNSAVRDWRGERTRWRGRAYNSDFHGV